MWAEISRLWGIKEETMDTVKIGWGRSEISMEGPISIPGQMYVRISKGVLDPLYATAVCVDGGAGQKAVIFCSVDVVVLGKGIIKETMRRCKEKCPDMPVEAIVMNATHTHSSINYWSDRVVTPDGVEALAGQEVYDHVCNKIVEACCEAWTSRKAGGIGYGYGYAVVGHSRRVCYSIDRGAADPLGAAPNGHAVMYGGTNRPEFSHYEAGADHFLNVMFTFDGQEKLTGMILNVPCPSQVSGGFEMLSSDYWHDVRELVKTEFGPDVKIVTQCGCAGDLSPRILHYWKAQARRMELKYGMGYDPYNNPRNSPGNINKCMSERKDIAERIVQGAKEVYSWAKKEIFTQLPVDHVSKELTLRKRMITEEEKQWCEDNIAYMEANIPDTSTSTPEEVREAVSRFQSVKNRNKRAIDRFHTQNEEPTQQMLTHVCRIGDICFATNRFELYMDYMHRMQARSPFIQTFTIQMAGTEESCYLATERGIANKGYSASLFCNQIGAEGGQQIVEETLVILNEMKAKDEA